MNHNLLIISHEFNLNSIIWKAISINPFLNKNLKINLIKVFILIIFEFERAEISLVASHRISSSFSNPVCKGSDISIYSRLVRLSATFSPTNNAIQLPSTSVTAHERTSRVSSTWILDTFFPTSTEFNIVIKLRIQPTVTDCCWQLWNNCVSELKKSDSILGTPILTNRETEWVSVAPHPATMHIFPFSNFSSPLGRHIGRIVWVHLEVFSNWNLLSDWLSGPKTCLGDSFNLN